MSDEFRIAPMDVEPDEVDPMHAEGGRARALHAHYCIVCDDYWEHDAGDEGCVNLKRLDCPAHDDRSRLI